MSLYRNALRSSLLALTMTIPTVQADQSNFSKVASTIYTVESCLDQFATENKDCYSAKYLVELSKGIDETLAKAFYSIESSGKFGQNNRLKLFETLTPLTEMYQAGLKDYKKANKSRLKKLLTILDEKVEALEQGAEKVEIGAWLQQLRDLDPILADSVTYTSTRDSVQYIYHQKLTNVNRLRVLLYELAGKRKSPNNHKMLDSSKYFTQTFGSVASLIIHAEACLDMFSTEAKDCYSGYSMYNIAYQAAPEKVKDFYNKYSDRKFSQRNRIWLNEQVKDLQGPYKTLFSDYQKKHSSEMRNILPLIDEASKSFDDVNVSAVSVVNLLKALNQIDPVLAEGIRVITHKASNGDLTISNSKKDYLYRLQWIAHKVARSRKRLKRGKLFSSSQYFDSSFSSLASLIYHAEACLDQFNKEQSECYSGYSLYNMSYQAAPKKTDDFYGAYSDRKLSQRKRAWLNDQILDLKSQYQEMLPAFQSKSGDSFVKLTSSLDHLISLLEDPNNASIRIHEFMSMLRDIDPLMANSLAAISFKTGDDKAFHFSKSKLPFLYRLKGVFLDVSDTEVDDKRSQTFSSAEYFNPSFGAQASMVYLIESCLDQFHQESKDCYAGYSLYNHTFKVDPSMTDEFYSAYSDRKINQRKRVWLHEQLEKLEEVYEDSVRSFPDEKAKALRALADIVEEKITTIKQTGEAVDMSDVKSALDGIDIHLAESLKAWTYGNVGQELASASKLNYLYRLRGLFLDIAGSRKKITRAKVFSSHSYFTESFSSLITMISYAKSCIKKMNNGSDYCYRGYSLYNRSFQVEPEDTQDYYSKYSDSKLSSRHKDWLSKKVIVFEEQFTEGLKEYSIENAKSLKALVAELSGLVNALKSENVDFTEFIASIEKVDVALADGLTSVSHKSGVKSYLAQSTHSFMVEFQQLLVKVVKEYSEDDVSMILTSKQVLFMLNQLKTADDPDAVIDLLQKQIQRPSTSKKLKVLSVSVALELIEVLANDPSEEALEDVQNVLLNALYEAGAFE
ncbi:MAG: hypothetical protein KC646_13505 [Candidatus Cloacimonetes bacterium]|nr:hypothetical protein [Candidatus Cloacimonadota bacterium]